MVGYKLANRFISNLMFDKQGKSHNFYIHRDGSGDVVVYRYIGGIAMGKWPFLMLDHFDKELQKFPFSNILKKDYEAEGKIMFTWTWQRNFSFLEQGGYFTRNWAILPGGNYLELECTKGTIRLKHECHWEIFRGFCVEKQKEAQTSRVKLNSDKGIVENPEAYIASLDWSPIANFTLNSIGKWIQPFIKN